MCHTQVVVEQGEGQDEINQSIKQFLDTRYVESIEACWRIFRFDMHREWPNVVHLAVHDADQHVRSETRIINPVSLHITAMASVFDIDTVSKVLLPGYTTDDINASGMQKLCLSAGAHLQGERQPCRCAGSSVQIHPAGIL